MRRISSIIALLLVFAACSADGTTTTTVEATGSTATSETTTSNAAEPTTAPSSTTTTPSSTTSPTTSTTTTTTTTTTPVATATTLAGEPFDLGPLAGDRLGVVGVASDDVLNVRVGPGTDQAIIARLSPLYSDIIATGEHRILTQSIWNQVTVGSFTGWANSSYMAYLGSVDDITSDLVASSFGGTIPTAETMLDLGMLVANDLKSDDPASKITVSVAPDVGDLGEITIDIIGLGDDALFGIRIVVFGQPFEDGFSLGSVERQLLCGRGLSDGGLCP